MLSVMMVSIIVNRDRMLELIVLVYIKSIIRSYATHRDNLHLVGRGVGAGWCGIPGVGVPFPLLTVPRGSRVCVEE